MIITYIFTGCKNNCLDKVVYLGNRKFLPTDHQLRYDKEHFPLKAVESEQPPQLKQYDDLLWNHLAYEGAPNKSQASIVAKATGCKALSSFVLLPQHDRTVQTFPDPMHTIPNAVQALFKLITGKDDSLKVRKAEKELGRFGEACSVEIQPSPSLMKGKESDLHGQQV